jgi:O-antigen/teichoic acid export membrane protein
MRPRADTILINSISSYARMGISMVLGLLITRRALEILSQTSPIAKETFGVFMLLISVATATQFLNESTQQAMVRFLSISLHNEDPHSTQRWFNSGWVMSTTISGFVALVMVVAAPWIVSAFNIPAAMVAPAQLMIRLAALTQTINATTQPWSAALSADDRYTLLNILFVVQQGLTLSGLQLLPVLPVDPLIGLSLVWFIPSIVVGIVLAVWVALQKPFLRLNWQFVQWQDCQQLFALGGWSSVIGLASNLYERTDQILINLLIGPTGNAIYAIAVQLGGALNRLVTSFTSVLLPTAARVATSGSMTDKQQLIVSSTRYVLILALPCAVGVALFRREIIELWLGKGFEPAITILPLTILLMLCRIPIFVTWPYLTAANRLQLPAIAIFCDGSVNVLLSIAYVKIFDLGLAGIVLGTLSTNLVRFIFFQIPFVARLVELPLSRYWIEGYTKPMLSVIWLVPLLWWLQSHQFSFAITLIGLLAIGVFYFGYIWFYVLNNDERKLILSLLNKQLQPNES